MVWGSFNEQLFVDIVCAQPSRFRGCPNSSLISRNMSETSGSSVFCWGKCSPMRFACSVTSGNRCRFSCFLGEQSADQ